MLLPGTEKPILIKNHHVTLWRKAKSTAVPDLELSGKLDLAVEFQYLSTHSFFNTDDQATLYRTAGCLNMV